MKFDMEAKSYESFGFVLMALVKKGQTEQEQLMQQNNTHLENIAMKPSQIERAQRFGQYAINMYPASWKGDLETIAKRMGITASSILVIWFNDDEDEGHCPKFLRFLNHEPN